MIGKKWILYNREGLQGGNIMSKEGKVRVDCGKYESNNGEVINYRKEEIEGEFGVEVKATEKIWQKGGEIRSGTGISTPFIRII